MKKALLAIAGLLLLVVAGSIYAVLSADPGPDRVQIESVLENARLGAEACNASRALSCVSPQYHDANGNSYSSLRIMAMQALRHGTPEIALKTGSLDIHGDKATSEAHLRVKLKDQANMLFEGDIHLEWAREDSPRLLVFPGKQWRITSMSGWNPSEMGAHEIQ